MPTDVFDDGERRRLVGHRWRKRAGGWRCVGWWWGDGWWLELDSELKFVGDSNSVEPGASSRRRGYELVSFWRPFPQLAIDASFTVSRARYFGALAAPGETHIAGAIESAGELGVSYIDGPWEISARLRHLGPYPLVEDDSERASYENEQ